MGMKEKQSKNMLDSIAESAAIFWVRAAKKRCAKSCSISEKSADEKGERGREDALGARFRRFTLCAAHVTSPCVSLRAVSTPGHRAAWGRACR